MANKKILTDLDVHGKINLSGTTNPEITFNGSSDAGIDMAIKATPEGLDFYEPEDTNKIHFQIKDDAGVNAVYGLEIGGTSVINSSRVVQNVSGSNSLWTNDEGYITSYTNTQRTDEEIRDLAANQWIDGTNTTVVYDDASNTIKINSTDTNTHRDIDDTPVNGATTTSISSNWAFDNVKTAVPSGAVFTDTNTHRAISSTPTNGATTTSISSDWAFDNVKTAVPSGAVFTDTDTNTTYSTATSGTLGLVKIGFTESGKNYPVELSSGKMYVNVPWSDTDTNTTYSSSDFTHDDLTGFVANEHIDWTADQGATNIHSGNYTDTNTHRSITSTPVNGDSSTSISSDWAFDNVKTAVPSGALFTDTNTTYSVGDGGLTQKNFTTTLKTKLDGIEENADVTPTWVPASDPSYLTSSSTQSKYLRSDQADSTTGTLSAPKFYVGTASGTSQWAFQARNNSSTADSGIYFASNSADLYLRNSSNNIGALIKSSGTSYFNGGNVGVGTSSADATVTIFRDESTYAVNLSNTETRAGLSVKSANLYDSKLNFSTGADSQQYIQAVNNAATTGRPIVLNPYGGYIGIKTDSAPTQPLDIISGTNAGIRLSATDDQTWRDIGIRSYVSEAQANALTDHSYIFTTNPSSATETAFAKYGGLVIQGRDDGNSSFAIRLGNGSGYATRFHLGSTGVATFSNTVTATNFILSSDNRLKEKVEEVDNKSINVDWKTFEMKSNKGQKRYGVIAQELEEVHPEFVRTNEEGMKSVAYVDLLIAKIAELEARLVKVENK